MNRKQADIAAGTLVAAILLFGIVGVIQLHLSDGPMASEMGPIPVMAVIGPLLMSLVIASVVGGVYVFVRGQVFTTPTDVSNEADGGSGLDDATDATTNASVEPQQSEPLVRRQLLDVLPDDERRILEPVIESPGLTQIAVRDRSDYSKSKVSQTITDLEERGLLYRESQGRTYRVYPAEDLDEQL